jgi:tetratricopeptide (TPR) repeat protein
LVALPIIVLSIFLSYRAGRILLGEYYFTASLNSLFNNEAQATYTQMVKAIQINPRVDRYRATFSRVNLILADSIARKGNLTDNDRSTITQLVQAAIQEGKATVALNPLRAANWEVLGRTYQSIIPLTTGADGFAAQSFQQAIALDPINPNYRIVLGGIYYTAKNYESASRIFELAVSSKPDLANGHYNLGFAYREAGKLDAAIQQMTLVLSLVDPKSKDYEAAKTVLDDLQAKKKAATPAGTESLTPPVAQGQPSVKPPIQLPAGSEPPTAPITPTPVESVVSPTPTPTSTP